MKTIKHVPRQPVLIFQVFTILALATHLIALSLVHAQTGNKVVVVPLGADEKSISQQCAWVASENSCILGAAEGSLCSLTAQCPADTHVISGGCPGNTSIAIGRTVRVGNTGWSCNWRRIQDTGGPTIILHAEAYCCGS